jgi:hypothetical protein
MSCSSYICQNFSFVLRLSLLLLQICKDMFHQLVTFTCLWSSYQNSPTSLHICMEELHYFVTYFCGEAIKIGLLVCT